nr:FAD-binding protein [Halocella sp. SP3-1]
MVVGGGGAACRAALEAAENGAQVLMILKGKIGKSGATSYKVAEMAGFNVADGQVDPNDSPEEHYKDIINAGYGMADPTLARIVAEEAPQTLRTLSSWGVPFEMEDGHFYEFLSCFSTRPRTHVIKGHGEPIMDVLIKRIRKIDQIFIYEDSVVTNLFIQDGECVGVGLIDNKGKYKTVSAGAVILATGGAGQLFARNLNPADICGDGYTLGFEAGAELVNLEFMQVGLGIVFPIINILNAWIWSAHPTLTNKYGKSFLCNYLPNGVSSEEVMNTHSHHFPFSSADLSRYLELAIQGELVKDCGTDKGGVYLDLTKITDKYLENLSPNDDFRKMWPITRNYLLEKGVDVEKSQVQIACFAHAINGGLKINSQAQTTIPGLYAAGEVAGGPHGADRLGGNMMVTCQIFGARAGRFAAEEALKKGRIELSTGSVKNEYDRIQNLIGREIEVENLKKRLQDNAQSKLLVRRDVTSLESFLDTINQLRFEIKQSSSAKLNRKVWGLHSLLTIGELMANAALFRQESRGSHFRTDYSKSNDKFIKPFTIIRSSNRKPKIS